MLNKEGKYVGKLDIQQTSLLLLLKKQSNKELTISLPLKAIAEDGGIFHKNELSMDVLRAKVKIKTSYQQDRFHFDYHIRMNISVVERLFPNPDDGIREMIEDELEQQFTRLIQQIQDKKIDPIGLGVYARAFEYDQYKKVEDNWGEALAKAKIDVNVDIDIKSMGATN